MYISIIEYYKIVVFFFVALCLIFIMLYLSKIFSLFFDKNRDLEKISAYECGFDPFNDARLKFEIQYFIIGILFIVFDLEIAFLFP
jgi:NADH-quinone oxidoreductase subunit A